MLKPVVPADDDFPPMPDPRPLRHSTKTTSKKRGGGYEIFDPVPAKFYLGLLGVVAFFGVWSLVHASGIVLLIGVLGMVSFGLIMYGQIGIVVIPFFESVACGLLCFLPIYPFYYLIMWWSAMRGSVLNSLAGVAIAGVALSLCIWLLLPAIAAEMDRNEAARASTTVAGARGPAFNPPPPGGMNFGPAAPDPVAVGQSNPAGPNVAAAGPGPGGRLAPGRDPGGRLPFGPRAGFGLPSGFGRPQGTGPGVGPPPGFGGPGFAPPGNAPAAGAPEETVTIRVANMVDEETSALFNEKLGEVIRGAQFRGTGGGGRWTYTVWPVADVQALADKLTFAKVTKVQGRTIQVEAVKSRPGESRPADSDVIAQVLFDLKSPAKDRRQTGLRTLSNMPPDAARREEIAAAVELILKDGDPFSRAEAAKALGSWGGPESTKALVATLNDSAFNVVWAALDALKARKDPAAAEALARLLSVRRDRFKAVEALKEIGPPAEPFVLKFLDDPDVFTRMDAAKLLQFIGTEACVEPLQTLLHKANGFGLDADAARATLRALNAPETPARKRGDSGLAPGTRKR